MQLYIKQKEYENPEYAESTSENGIDTSILGTIFKTRFSSKPSDIAVGLEVSEIAVRVGDLGITLGQKEIQEFIKLKMKNND